MDYASDKQSYNSARTEAIAEAEENLAPENWTEDTETYCIARVTHCVKAVPVERGPGERCDDCVFTDDPVCVACIKYVLEGVTQ